MNPENLTPRDQAAPAAPTPAPQAPPAEDAGARALAEALRSSFRIVKWMMVLLVGAFFASCIFTVKPNQVAIVLRFGKPLGVGKSVLRQPGPHFALPYPIDEIVRIPIGESQTVVSRVGWYATTPEEEATGQKPPALASLRPGLDGYTLTADGNIIHARATLSYRIQDPLQYYFDFANTTNLLQSVLDSALVYASLRFSADDALYRNKTAFQELVLQRVSEGIERLKLGVTVDPREVRTSPPLFVESAFNDVLKAQQTADIKIKEAEAYARGATNRALGEYSTVVNEGMNRSNAFVQILSSQAESFEGLRPGYEVNPGLFRDRLLAETMERVLARAQFKAFLPERDNGRPREIRLLLNQEPEVPKSEAPAR